MDSLDPKELADEVLTYLDAIEEIGEQEVQELLGNRENQNDSLLVSIFFHIPEGDGANHPISVLFVSNKNDLNERKDYKKLPAALPDVKVCLKEVPL